MGNSRSQLQLQEEEINEITAETGFTKQQVRVVLNSLFSWSLLNCSQQQHAAVL